MASTHQLQSGNHIGGENREAGTSSTRSCTLLDFDLNLCPAEQFDGEDCISEIPLNIVCATGESAVQGEQQYPLRDPRGFPYLQKGKGKMIDNGGVCFLDLQGGNREAGTSSTRSCTLLDFDLNISPAGQFDGEDSVPIIPLNAVSATGVSSVQGEQQAPLSDPKVFPYLQKGKRKMIDNGGVSFLDLHGEKESQSASCEPSLLMLPEVRTFSLGAENVQVGPSAVPNGVPFDDMVLQNIAEASNRANNRQHCLELFPLGNRNRNVVVDAEELPSQTLRLYHHQLEMAMFGQLDRNSSFAPRERKVMGIQNRRAIVSPSETSRLPESGCRVKCALNRNPSELTPLRARNGGRKKDGHAKEHARSRKGTALLKSMAHKKRRNE